MKYEQESKQVRVVLNNLSFPNGVALSNGGSFLVFAETTKCRILRYWLNTSKAETLETFAQLPGFPDNIIRSPRGGFWVAMHSRRDKILAWILSFPRLGNALVRLPIDVTKAYLVLSKYRGSGLAMTLSEDGEILETIEDKNGNKISEVHEKDGNLWIGSIDMPFVVHSTKHRDLSTYIEGTKHSLKCGYSLLMSSWLNSNSNLCEPYDVLRVRGTRKPRRRAIVTNPRGTDLRR
ncbi:Strictosidine synthase-like 2, putative [Theobroma cacao]|uniref:Strictosidine synthase-like 2, putative n=1 Tax=Theobroma cacao TaxID=3641 RepID=A0A061F3A5_THECC|nr:Strictosidine synthase-like 2, putative [Theobroma cacao]